MATALFLSPHLDDVAFSCGGTCHRLAARGWRTTLCTVFTRSVPDPRGFALACQLDKGLGPEVDYMALRRAEDAEAGRCLGAAETLWLDLPEAPHRGYHAAPALFGPFASADRIEPALRAALEPLLARHDLVFAPQGIGDHVDHRRVRDLVAASAAAARTVWYREMPYAVRHPEARPDAAALSALAEVVAAFGGIDLAAKLAACAAYASQLGFQFGGEAAMRACLRGFAGAEAARLGSSTRLAEALLVPDEAAALLREEDLSAG